MRAVLPIQTEPGNNRLGNQHPDIATREGVEALLLELVIVASVNLDSAGNQLG